MTSPIITLDTRAFQRYLGEVARSQMPFALSLAINDTVNDGQQAVRNAIDGSRGFVFRTASSRAWIKRQIRRNRGEDFATKRNLVGRLRIQDRGRASLLSLIDQGGTRSTQFQIAGTGGDNLPIPARRSPTDRVPRTLFPGKLQLERRGTQVKGARRTFVVKTASGDTLLLQRTSKKRVRTLFVLERQAEVMPRNFFAPTVERTVLTRFDDALIRGLRRAIATAR